MTELKLWYDSEPRSRLGDWMIRAGVAVTYFAFGTDKFGADPHWIKLFHDIGMGD